MKRLVTIQIVALTLMLGLSSLASAQMGGGNNSDDPRIERIRMEMEQTDQMIERAREAVEASGSPAARLALEKAVQLQDQARDQFRQGTLNGYLQAARLTREARNLAKKSMVSSRYSEQNEDRVLARLERVQELLNRAGESLTGQGRSPRQPLFDLARDNMDKAWQFYRANQHRVALKLADHVESTARRILESSGRGPGAQGQFSERMGMIERRLEQIRERMADGQCDSEAAQKFMEQARRALEIARQAGARGEIDIAMESLQQARQLGSEAFGYCQNGFQVQNQYERTLQRWEEMSDIVPAGSTADEILQQAARQLELARQSIDNERFDAAAAALRVAQMQLRQVEEQLRIGQQ